MAIAVIVTVIILAVKAGSSVDLDKYLTIKTEGYEGYGTVSAEIDWSAIKKKYGKKIVFTTQGQNTMREWWSDTSPMDFLEDSVGLDFEKSSNLSNGETVSYTWAIDEDLYDYIDVKLKYKDGKYTVSGLQTVGTFDAFANVEVKFSGYSPNGNMELTYNGNELSRSNFTCEKTNGLKNGDTVTIKIDSSSIDSIVKKLGKAPAESEKQYVVSGLDEFVGKYADLTEDIKTKMRSEAEDAIVSYAATGYDQTTSLSGLAYAGYIMSMSNDADSYYSDTNYVYIIYTGTLSDSEGRFSTTKVYFPVRFSNIMKKGETMEYSENEGIVGYSDLEGSWESTKGYTNPLKCYMEIVEANKERYSSECGDGFEVYEKRVDVAKLADIGDNGKKLLSDDAKKRIESYIAGNYNAETVVTGLTLKGEYLLVAKTQGADFAENNRYIVVYSATLSHTNNDFAATTVYFPVEYDGIIKLPDEYMVTETRGILGDSVIPDSSYSTNGYIDGKTMFSELVTANRGEYTYEVSEGLKEFGS